MEHFQVPAHRICLFCDVIRYYKNGKVEEFCCNERQKFIELNTPNLDRNNRDIQQHLLFILASKKLLHVSKLCNLIDDFERKYNQCKEIKEWKKQILMEYQTVEDKTCAELVKVCKSNELLENIIEFIEQIDNFDKY
jgi:hypothetical protein